MVYEDIDPTVPVYNLMESFDDGETVMPQVVKATTVQVRVEDEDMQQLAFMEMGLVIEGVSRPSCVSVSGKYLDDIHMEALK